MSELPPLLTRMLGLRPHAVELLRPTRNTPPLGWLLLAVGTATLGGVVFTCQPVWSERTALAAEEAKLAAALERAGGTARPRPAARNGEHDTLAEAAQIAAEARRPWHQLFDQIEAAQLGEGAGVHLVQVAVDPRFSNLQVVAEGRDLGGLVRFSGQLTGKGPIRAMALTHHEWRDTLGAHVVTASLTGELDGSAVAAEAGPAATAPATAGRP